MWIKVPFPCTDTHGDDLPQCKKCGKVIQEKLAAKRTKGISTNISKKVAAEKQKEEVKRRVSPLISTPQQLVDAHSTSLKIIKQV